MENKIQTLALLNSGRFSVHLDEVGFKTGQRGKRIRIYHPEASAVIPFISEHEILMVRQYRYALERETLEIPAGKIDPGEKPEEGAQRELQEETGYGAEKLTYLYTYAPAIGYSNELIHIYSGKELKEVGTAIDEREIASVERIHLREVLKMIEERAIIDGKTLLALALVKAWQGVI